MMLRCTEVWNGFLGDGRLQSCLGIINGMTMNDLLSVGREAHAAYDAAQPYPHICLDNFLDAGLVARVAGEFPELGEEKDMRFNDPNQLKAASRGEYRFGPATRE